jgi:aminopeptidase YwaD
MSELFEDRILKHLKELCNKYPHRSTGSKGNIHSVAYYARQSEALGYEISEQEFDCIDWEAGKVELSSSEECYNALPSPWSLGVNCRGELVSINSVEKLQEADLAGKIVLLHGGIAKEQLMPKNFVFYNPEEHQLIIKLLEEKNPSAIITATEKNPETAGALYPFPLFEDGDFDIPSVYMTAEEGEKLLKKGGDIVTLKFQANRFPAKGSNIIARKGDCSAKKIVLTAHIDTKPDTPGAIDNASGVVLMLIMMEMLKDYEGKYCLEFLAMNGEDYYAASGEMKYLAELGNDLSQVELNINFDAAGFRGVKTGYTGFGENSELLNKITGILSQVSFFTEIKPWYQGDHMVFVMNGVPALAVTSENFVYITEEIAHTEKDTIAILDCRIIEETARSLAEIIMDL